MPRRRWLKVERPVRRSALLWWCGASTYDRRHRRLLPSGNSTYELARHLPMDGY